MSADSELSAMAETAEERRQTEERRCGDGRRHVLLSAQEPGQTASVRQFTREQLRALQWWHFEQKNFAAKLTSSGWMLELCAGGHGPLSGIAYATELDAILQAHQWHVEQEKKDKVLIEVTRLEASTLASAAHHVANERDTHADFATSLRIIAEKVRRQIGFAQLQ